MEEGAEILIKQKFSPISRKASWVFLNCQELKRNCLEHGGGEIIE